MCAGIQKNRCISALFFLSQGLRLDINEAKPYNMENRTNEVTALAERKKRNTKTEHGNDVQNDEVRQSIKKNKLILDNGIYRYEIEKTDFEKAYSKELLLQFANMLSMDFGVEDYYDWNTTGENVFKDIFVIVQR